MVKAWKLRQNFRKASLFGFGAGALPDSGYEV